MLMRFNRLLIKLESVLSAGLLAALLGLVSLQVLSRHIYFMPMNWTEEIARYTMIWLTFVAAAKVTSGDGHISINILERWFGPNFAFWNVILARLFVFGACLALLPGGWRFVNGMMRVSTPAAGIPFGYIYAACFVGIALIGLHSLLSAYLIFIGKIDPSAPPELMESGIEEGAGK